MYKARLLTRYPLKFAIKDITETVKSLFSRCLIWTNKVNLIDDPAEQAPDTVEPGFLFICVLVMFLICVFHNKRFNRFLWFLASLINNNGTLRKCSLFSCRYKNLCTKCWSNLTLKCYANTSVKVDAHIEVKCRQTISYLKGYSYLKLYCKKQSNQKPTANIVSTTRRNLMLSAR